MVDKGLQFARLRSAASTLRGLDGDSALGRGCGLHDIAKKIDDAVAKLESADK